MNIYTAWDNPGHTVLRFDISGGPWEWDTFITACEEANRFLETVNHPVGIIISIEPDTAMPVDGMWNLSCLNLRNPNRAMTIIVGETLFIQRLFDTLRRVNPGIMYRVQFMPTMAEARATLSRITC